MTRSGADHPDDPHRLGLLVNPIAGMGGRVGLKGTDGVVERAVALGAEPTAHAKAHEMLSELRQLVTARPHPIRVEWLTCSGAMGADSLASAGFEDFTILHEPGEATSADDTRRAVRRFVGAGAELIVFCGGDGTARDVCSITQATTPVLGVPAGVKMYSGVFGVTPARAAQILFDYLVGDLDLAEVEILDIDEERYRRGEWAVRLYATARTPFEPSLTQAAKALITGVSESEVCGDIADEVIERLESEPETLVLLGAGSTVEAVGRRLGIDKTLLGVDAVVDREVIGVDLNEQQLLRLLAAHRRCVLVLSPIGAQGFVLGRGNQQLSPEVVRRIGPANVIVVATPAKLQRTPVLHFDTGDRALDAAFANSGYLQVVTGYHQSRLVKVAT
ncbi:MAG: ATP-NAD kinase family protein [Acidimicrobiia bacterium]|nr:ATP-NAD kinase family protein [Acidimicrobiia bacterium]